jgi:hypothetical protein
VTFEIARDLGLNHSTQVKVSRCQAASVDDLNLPIQPAELLEANPLVFSRAAAIPTHLLDRLWLRESHVAWIGLLTQSRAVHPPVSVRRSLPFLQLTGDAAAVVVLCFQHPDRERAIGVATSGGRENQTASATITAARAARAARAFRMAAPY